VAIPNHLGGKRQHQRLYNDNVNSIGNLLDKVLGIRTMPIDLLTRTRQLLMPNRNADSTTNHLQQVRYGPTTQTPLVLCTTLADDTMTMISDPNHHTVVINKPTYLQVATVIDRVLPMQNLLLW
jgi:hypothetical protein